MKPDELRRLAIRLAVYIEEREDPADGWQARCFECCAAVAAGDDLTVRPKHTPNCPIAELEAEEARGETVITLLASEWAEVQLDVGFGAKRMAWVKLGSFEVKPKGEFRGEF